MQLLADGEAPVHNSFNYDPATGDVVLHLASFSEVAVVAEPAKWEGTIASAFNGGTGTEDDPYIIANADQLAYFGAVVGGMVGFKQNSFNGEYIKLVCDIDLADDEEHNVGNKIFYPIGYYNSEGTYERTNTAITSGLRTFEGTFDGNGNTISNFYQNTWEMKGDHDWYSPEEQYYRDGMGLFGRVYKGTIKNLTVKNFSSDGEIATTGVIAAYADGATFENIAIFNCNPRVYNIGNGGIVGCVGWYAKEANLETKFKNITVDNSNKISALWGSYDVACGGIVGQYYPTSGQTSAGTPANGGIHFENCHISAQMDVYNDVCANYQYYAYRYTGMLIGSVRENVTIDGHSYPKMDGITAEGCTVHFGTWNDYYYCEIIDNTTASYTHDYQMSRLTEIKAIDGTTITYLDGTTGTVPASGRANYVIVDYSKGHGTENATCYHFKDGKVWNHEDGGKETINGVEVLKEDKQHIYLEFNNLVTGYGWGVTSRGFDNLDGVTNLDISEGDYEESVNKFNPLIQNGTNIATESTITIGELFAAINDAGVDIKSDNVQVTISPFGATSTAGGTYVANTTDWTQGTLTFSGLGQAVITITDYYFCNTTTVTVNIVGAEKFDTNFVNYKNYLYRVGNADKSTVALGTIFKHSGNGTINSASVNVTIETVAGNASGSFTANKTDWTKGTIQFTGTGVVKVSIKDDTSKEFVLNLEVVDAVNATGAMNATSNNVVLLNDAGFSSVEVKNGYTFYGNGFALTATQDRAAKNMSYGFVQLENGTLDNVQIICPNFAYAILYNKNFSQNNNPTDGDGRYYNIRSAVVADKDSKIINSYISGGRAAVYASSGTLLIDNSTIEGGAAANIHAGTCTLTLRDVTLIQEPKKATTNGTSAPSQDKTVMGVSVFVQCDTNGLSSPIILEGTLNQYAWANEDYSEYVPDDGKSLISTVLNQKNYIQKVNGKDSINLGIVFMPYDTIAVKDPVANGMIVDNRTNKTTLPYGKISINNAAYVYSSTTISNENIEVAKPIFVPSEQGITSPSVSFTDTNNAREFETFFDAVNNKWVSVLKVDVDQGAYSFSFAKLLVQKYGINLNYTITKADGTLVDKNASINLDNSSTTEYILTITDDQFYDENGTKVEGVTATHTHIYRILATKTSIQSPVWVNGTLTGTGLPVGDSKNSDWNAAVPVLDGLSVKYWSKADGKEKTLNFSDIQFANLGKQNGTNNSITISVENEYTLVISTTGFKDDPKDNGMPVVVNNGGKKTLYFVVASSGHYVSKNTTSRTITIAYTFTDANNTTPLTKTLSMTVTNDGIEKKYSDFCNGTLTDAGSGCVTGDTLVTLADGTQKRIDALDGTEMLLVWDFYKGEYTISPVGAIVNHGYDMVNEVTMSFANGSSIKTLRGHGFYDVSENKFIIIDEFNISEYIGHEFVVYDATGNATTTVLVDYSIESKYEEIWTIVSAVHFNCVLNGMLTLSPTDFPNSPAYLMPFEIGEGMKYDEEKMQDDIEKYGQYTYEDFAEYCTYEQFVGFNFANWKVAVGKGYITYEEIIYLIEAYVN